MKEQNFIKDSFLNWNSHNGNIDNKYIRKSMLNQIEIIIELINTTKLKISLIQQFQNGLT